MSPATKSPRTSTTPACRSDTPRVTSAALAPASTTTTPAGWAAKAIHSLRAVNERSWAANVVPMLATLLTASLSTLARVARAITVRTPDQLAIRAAASLEAMPPLPRVVPDDPARTDINSSSAATSLISTAAGLVAGSAVYKPSVSVNNTKTSASML